MNKRSEPQIPGVIVVRLFAASPLRLVQIFIYTSSVSVKSAETQADYDGRYEATRAEVAELGVTADERMLRIGTVQYAAAIDVAVSV